MISIIVTCLICITIIYVVVHITNWLSDLWAETKQYEVPEPRTMPLGFTTPEPIAPATPVVEEEKKKTPKEEQEELLKDATTMISTLLRGEVDFDDI